MRSVDGLVKFVQLMQQNCPLLDGQVVDKHLWAENISPWRTSPAHACDATMTLRGRGRFVGPRLTRSPFSD